MLVIFVVFVVVVEIALHAADDFGAGFFIHPLITTTSLGKPRIISCLPFLSTPDPTLSSINHCILFSTAKNSDAFGTSWLRTICIR